MSLQERCDFTRAVTHQVVGLSGLYEVYIGARVHIHYVSGRVGRQQQSVVAALVRQPRQELRLRVVVAIGQPWTIS